MAMQKQAECWQPLCAVTQRLVSKLEQQHRDKFKRDCRDDGVSRETKEREDAHA